jgi:hypothetical protein
VEEKMGTFANFSIAKEEIYGNVTCLQHHKEGIACTKKD